MSKEMFTLTYLLDRQITHIATQNHTSKVGVLKAAIALFLVLYKELRQHKTHKLAIVDQYGDIIETYTIDFPKEEKND